MSEPKRPAAGVPLRASQESARRREYVTPALVEYGSVAKLTQAGGMTSVDFLFLRGMGMTM